MARVGNVLIVLGLLAIGYAGLWQLGLAPGSRVSLPPPVALQATPPVAPQSTPVVALQPTLAPVSPASTLPPVQVAPPTPIALHAADAADRELDLDTPTPGYAVRLAIPAINLDTPVQQGGIVTGADGNPAWETLPFVAVHYGDLTARVGARGNAVIAGHVVTLQEGNVFRFLYQLDFGDTIEVWDEHDTKRDFRVVDVKLVPPSDVSVMAPTADVTLTLITCGGTFDPRTREFSERLIVTAKPL
jgi:LPXTG-site transpeptidase (sortase) family protein